MTASSQQSDLTKPSYGRLNGVRGNGWCAGTASSTHDWLQVDLGRTVKVCSLSAQGEVNGNRWVTDFKLRYSTDGISWRYYMNANGVQVVRFFNLNIFDSLYRNANFLPVNSSIRHLHISLNTRSFPLKLFHNGFFLFLLVVWSRAKWTWRQFFCECRWRVNDVVIASMEKNRQNLSYVIS